MSEQDDYSVPKPSKIKLKETKEDRYERHYRREQRRLEKEQRRVYRANGLRPPSRSRSPTRIPFSRSTASPARSRFQPISPIRNRDESLTPPRYGSGSKHNEYADELEVDDFAERLRWMEAETMRQNEPGHAMGFAAGDDGRGGYVHIPKHVRQAAGIDTPGSSSSAGRPPDWLDEEAYAEYIRDGMYRRANAEELARAAAAAARKEAAERKAALARAKAEEAEAERMAELKKEARKRDKALKRQRDAEAARDKMVDWRKEVQEYERRWAALREGHKVGAIALPPLGFSDFPWPIYRPRAGGRVMLADLTPDAIRNFLFSLVQAVPSGSKGDPIDIDAKDKDKKRVLRDAILAFHPDRFLSRFLQRAREDVKEDVQEAVGVCSRIINDLAAERK